MPMPSIEFLNTRRAAIALAIVIVGLFTAFSLPDLFAGTFRIRDEYTTLDRSNAFHVRKEYAVVYSNNIPSFRKPPLHYWMSSVMLDLGLPQNFSARMPSFLFGLGSIVFTGILAALFLPAVPLAAPAAMALVASNAGMIASSKAALLDTGTTFFALAAMTGIVLAIRNSRWWYLVAVACGLGSLQKAPTALLMVAISVIILVVARRMGTPALREMRLGGHFAASIALTLAIVLAWPALQWIQFGFSSIRQAYWEEMIQRFSPVAAEADSSRGAWHHYLMNDDMLFRLPALIALFAMPAFLKRPELYIFAALIALYGFVVFFAQGSVFPRYSLTFVPFLAASLAVAILYYSKNSVVAGALLALFCLQNVFLLDPSWKDASEDAPTIAMLEKFSETTGDDANRSVILCDWRPDKTSRIPPGLFSIHASGGRPFRDISSPARFTELRNRGEIGLRLHGLCTPAQLKELEPVLKNVTVIEDYGSHINFAAE